MTYEAETPRLWLERIAWKHFDDFHALVSSERTMMWSKRRPMATLDESREWLQQSFTSLYPDIDKYAILLRPTSDSLSKKASKMIGVIGTLYTGHEMAYMIHCDYWNKGYMTEALNALVGPEGVFWKLPNRTDTKSLLAQIDSENVASMKMVARLGARKGETKLKSYELARDRGSDGIVPEEKKRDMVCWYLDRPVGA